MSGPIDAASSREALNRLARSAGDNAEWQVYLRGLFARNLDQVVEDALDLVLELGPPVAELLRSAIESDASPELLDRLADRFENDPRRQLHPLRGIVDFVARRRLGLLLAREDLDLEERAEVARIGIRIAGFAILDGRPAEARGLLEAAVEILDDLASIDPASVRMEQAIAANDLAQALRDLELRAEALVWAERSLALLRELAREDPAHRIDVASALINLGPLRSELGDQRGALRDVRRSVAVLRRLVRVESERYRPDLALGLLALGNRQRVIGDYLAAKRSLEEAVDLLERLTGRLPAAAPRLAMALQNTAVVESGLGALDAAIRRSEESVAIYRRFAQDGGAADRMNLAESLRDLSGHLLDDERLQRAGEVIDEALALIRGLLRSGVPGVFETWADLLIHRTQARRKDLPSAIRSAWQALRIYRRLAERSPETYTDELATAFTQLGLALRLGGRIAEALAAHEQAVILWQGLAAREPAAHEVALAGALSNCASCQLELGSLDGALASASRATEFFRRLAAARPAAVGLHLAKSLRVLLKIYQAGGNTEGAWRAHLEIIEVLSGIPDVERRAGAFVLFTVEEHADLARAAGHESDEGLVEPLRRKLDGLTVEALLDDL